MELFVGLLISECDKFYILWDIIYSISLSYWYELFLLYTDPSLLQIELFWLWYKCSPSFNTSGFIILSDYILTFYKSFTLLSLKFWRDYIFCPSISFYDLSWQIYFFSELTVFYLMFNYSSKYFLASW